jgi:hypothetical protein
MTQAQEQHLLDIKQHFSTAVDKKYRKGQAEHGGNLWDRNTLDDIGDEAVDLVTYIYVAKERDNKLRLAVHNWRSGHITNEQAKKQIGDILGF